MLKGKLAKMRTTDRKIREGNTFLILALMGFRRYDVEGMNAMDTCLRRYDIRKNDPENQNWVPAFAGMTGRG